jgi:hypothetical protein
MYDYNMLCFFKVNYSVEGYPHAFDAGALMRFLQLLTDIGWIKFINRKSTQKKIREILEEETKELYTP